MSRERRGLWTLPIVAGGVIATSLLTATPALADGQACFPRACSSSPAAGARWEDHGDMFYVHDYKADGKGTIGIIEYHVPGEGWYGVGNRVFYNTKGSDGPPARFNLEVREGVDIRYMTCLGKVASGYCSDWKYESNNG
ncbi:hypothetical protein OHA98_19140 [Streptomyces sp. NBC_00654]|uniref:hypothetical protein n=1 Tax=Streptomyces sp. NBC_00654 TaxID=2975799 RepID=UPI0022548F00|nr:hypothetical protein [Streptomyces sp. NBC_00654]MCX4966907.1 hypothetical protein [Streptomyces sp. NBC_00654]